MSRVMIVAGGEWQVPIVKKAKEMGHLVICSNLYRDSPAFAYADIGETADVLDKEANLRIARMNRPDAIITDQSDIAVPTVAWLCEKLGLRGIGTEKAFLFTNKEQMRRFCMENGFPHPAYKMCTAPADAYGMLSNYGEIIIKPIDSQSSRGVFLVRTLEELEENFYKTRSFSSDEESVLAEEYISGTEFTVDGVKTDKGYKVLAVSEKAHFLSNPNIAKSLLFSYRNPRYDYDALRDLNEKMVLAMGLPFGLTHAEYKYRDGKYYLIEIAARGGGTRISSDIAPYVSDIDSNGLLISMALGEQAELPVSMGTDRFAILKFPDFRTGMVERILQLDEASAIPGILCFGLNFRESEEILPMSDDRSRPGYYIAGASSMEELGALCVQFENTLKIIYKEGSYAN